MKKHPQHIVATLNAHYVDRANGFCDYEITGDDIIIAQRHMLENNDGYRQVMPMVMFTHEGLVWAYRRAPSGGENKLHGKTAVFVGGHFDLEDVISKNSIIDLPASINKAVERELKEEIIVSANETHRKTLPYLVCADDTNVDRKHVAIVTVINLDGIGLCSNESHLEELGFLSPSELLESEQYDLETWARIAVTQLANGSI